MADPGNINCRAMFDLTPIPPQITFQCGRNSKERERKNFEDDYFMVCNAM
jgi:hypothetical protein